MNQALEAPAGNPAALAAAVDRYRATDQAIAAAAEDLMRVVLDGESAAVVALTGMAGTATGHLMQAHGRYEGTTAALRTFTVELESFHKAAADAIEREHAARSLGHDADAALADVTHRARSAAMNPGDPATVEHWQLQVSLARHRVDAAEDAIAAARADYFAAADSLDGAAQRAMGLIHSSFDGTDDSLVDRARQLLAEATSLVSSIAAWALDVLKAAVEAVVVAVAVVIAAVVVVIAVIALVQVLVVLLVAAVVLVANLIATLIEVLALLLVAGGSTFTVATRLGVDDLTRIRMVLASVAIACPALGLYLLRRIAGEASRPAPVVAPLDPAAIDDHDPATVTAQEQSLVRLESMEPDSVEDFLWQAGAVDTIGGSAQTVVDIAKIVHEDGTVSWVVTLPSTKDWGVPLDQGAVNDFDADLLMLAFPELKTQYERAVLDAMSQAGIGQAEPVLLTGWSLGGIMAGHLAETGTGGYDYAGVVVAGAPIDHMRIAAGIPVVQVKHMNDAVHRTDLIDSVPDRGSHISLWDGDRSGIGLDRKTGPTLGHDAGQYYDTLEAHVAANESINDDFRAFFVVDDPSHTGQPTIEHTQYAFSE